MKFLSHLLSLCHKIDIYMDDDKIHVNVLDSYLNHNVQADNSYLLTNTILHVSILRKCLIWKPFSGVSILVEVGQDWGGQSLDGNHTVGECSIQMLRLIEQATSTLREQ